MEYFKAIKFTDFIIFTEDTTDEELINLEKGFSQKILGTNKDKHIRFHSDNYYLYEWTTYSIVGLNNNPLNKSDFFYNGEIGRHNTGTLLFKNFIGAAKFRNVTFFIESKKMDTNDFNNLIEIIDERINTTTSLIFDSKGFAQAKFKKNKERFHHFYVYQKLFNSLKKSKIIPYIQYISNHPNYQLKKDIRTTKIELIQNLSSESVIDVFSGTTPVIKATKHNKSLGFSYKNLNIIPLEMNEHTDSISIDTNENQFVKFFINVCIRILTKFLNDLTNLDTGNIIKNSILISEIESFRKELQKHLRSNFFKDISNLNTINYSSTILTRRYGYKELYREYINLKKTPINCFDDKSLIELFQNRSVDKLYEYICLFKLVDLIQEIYKMNAVQNITFSSERIYTVSLSEANGGVSFVFPESSKLPETRLLFQHSFSIENNLSYSVKFEPDFTLQILKNSKVYNYHFDAKFRMSKESTSKNEDLVKMHGYRDGINNTIGAFVLFPGNSSETYIISDELPYQGVGAFPLNFDSSNDDILKDILSNILYF